MEVFMGLRILSFRVLVVVLPTIFWLNTAAQSESVADKLISLEFENESFGNVVSHLVNTYGVVFGFEESIEDRGRYPIIFATHYPDQTGETFTTAGGTANLSMNSRYPIFRKPIDLKFKNQKLSVVIDSLVSQLPPYTWELREGVVNIFPNNDRDSRVKRVLETKIKHFSVNSTDKVGKLKYKILRLPEIKESAVRNKLKIVLSRNIVVNDVALKKPLGLNANFAEISLLELLNKLALIKGGGWIIRIRNGMGSDLLDIEI